MEKTINARFTYTDERDITGRKYYELWDYSKMKGSGVMKSPTCICTSYSLVCVKNRAKQMMQ